MLLAAATLTCLLAQHLPSTAGLGRLLAGTFATSGAIALVGSRGRHPAWVIFGAIAPFAWLGSR